jgi:uncharacterized protein (TIGR01319 family)
MAWVEDKEVLSKLNKPRESMEYILATDVGSTTTKARYFEKINGEWRYVASGESPTTVEAPYEDVTMGVRNAVREVEELTGHFILAEDGSGVVVPSDGQRGVDLYCTTSSAGGGLQLTVSGVVKSMTAESANRAALGAGAIVMDVMAIDDGRRDWVKINRLRSLRPDMILLAGGTDGGTIKLVMEMAEVIRAAKTRPRFGVGYKLPLIFAGNKLARPEIKSIFSEDYALSINDNIRPILEQEVIEPTRRNVHELFMEHVMSHAPGYLKLMKWTDVDIMPTPAGEGMAMQLIAHVYETNVIGVGLGGATTNVYSIFNGRFVRSVSANLGMSYSICNVLKEAGAENILRWVPFKVDETDLENRLYNKMIRPTTIPQTLEDLIIEHAVSREALRLGMVHHKTIATRLKGIRVERDAGDIFAQALEDTYIKMMDIKIIAGTGGLLSHAPRRQQSLLILTDAFQPEGVTRLFQDSVFMMPHLGVLSTVYTEAAWSIFDKDCLIRLGTVIAAAGLAKEGDHVMDVTIEMPDGSSIEEEMKFGEIKRIPLPEGEEAEIVISPHRGFDVGAGPGHHLDTKVSGGVVGLIIDARGRPLILPEDEQVRHEKLLEWIRSLDLYPEDRMKELL